MNWVVVPRYTLYPLWLATLDCGHARAVPFEPTAGREMPCLQCRRELGFTSWWLISHACPIPRPLP